MEAGQMNDLKMARRMVRCMGIGLMPSHANAMNAQATLRSVAHEQGLVPPATAIRVTGAIANGLAPSQALCREAETECDAMIDSLRESQGQLLRERFGRVN